MPNIPKALGTGCCLGFGEALIGTLPLSQSKDWIDIL
jgi:hypothetical protein